MNSVEKVKMICKDRKIPISKLERDLGYSNGYISQLRKGVFPSNRLVEIANYLSMPISYFTEEVKETTLTPRDERDIANDLNRIMEKLRNGEDGPASFEGEDIPEADQELFSGQLELMLRRLKAINKEKYNPHKNNK